MNGLMWEGLKKGWKFSRTLTDSPLLRIKCVEKNKNKALPLLYGAKNYSLKWLKTA